MYEYKAKVINVVDGDTLDLDIDLGFDTHIVGGERGRIRLYGINTPEKTGATKEAGLKATEFTKAAVLGKTVTVRTIKDKQEKFGRLLGTIIYRQDLISVIDLDLAKELIAAGLGVEYFGGKR
jgi:micrococcal nuclease